MRETKKSEMFNLSSAPTQEITGYVRSAGTLCNNTWLLKSAIASVDFVCKDSVFVKDGLQVLMQSFQMMFGFSLESCLVFLQSTFAKMAAHVIKVLMSLTNHKFLCYICRKEV